MSLPPVSVCVVSFNTRDLLRACLTSVLAGTTVATELIVVDNASADGSADMVAKHFPQAHLVRAGSNLGYAAAANVAMRAARGRTVLLLNPDTLVPPGAIDALLAFLDAHPDVDVCGPALVYPDRRFQSCGAAFPSIASELRELAGHWWRRGPFRRWHVRRPAAPARVDWLCGACVLLRREALESVGPFDEAFHLYGEELDWFARAHRAGLDTWAVPSIEVVHYLGQSTATVHAWAHDQLVRTRVLYYRKHRGPAHAAIVRAIFALRRMIGRTVLPVVPATPSSVD